VGKRKRSSWYFDHANFDFLYRLAKEQKRSINWTANELITQLRGAYEVGEQNRAKGKSAATVLLPSSPPD
jgi:hypothetical protein